MAQQQEGGWPLGLQPLNLRVGVVRNRDHLSASTSFNTLLSDSPASTTDFSSDLDTESTGSFFPDRSTTLGSLIGVSRIVNLSRRSTRARSSLSTLEPTGDIMNKCNRRCTSIWCFSLCARNNTVAENATTMMSNNNNNNNTGSSLGHFLAVERSARSRRHHQRHSPLIYGPDEYALVHRDAGNSLFADGRIAPPRLSPWAAGRGRRHHHSLASPQQQGVPLVLFPCICG